MLIKLMEQTINGHWKSVNGNIIDKAVTNDHTNIHLLNVWIIDVKWYGETTRTHKFFPYHHWWMHWLNEFPHTQSKHVLRARHTVPGNKSLSKLVEWWQSLSPWARYHNDAKNSLLWLYLNGDIRCTFTVPMFGTFCRIPHVYSHTGVFVWMLVVGYTYTSTSFSSPKQPATWEHHTVLDRFALHTAVVLPGHTIYPDGQLRVIVFIRLSLSNVKYNATASERRIYNL